MGKQLFINPYNFVPFGSTVEEKRRTREEQYRGKESLVSGWLDVELYTKTPLIIPDGAHPSYWDCRRKIYVKNPTNKKELHTEYNFLRVSKESEGKIQTEPVIPGSELRGMIRSVYEMVTDSCIPFLLNDKLISQRIPVEYSTSQKRGLLAYEQISGKEQRHWVLYEDPSPEKAEVFFDKEKKKCEGKNLNKSGNTEDYFEKYGWVQWERQESNYIIGERIKYKKSKQQIREKNGDYIEKHGWLQYNIPCRKKGYHVGFLTPKKFVCSWEDDSPYTNLKSVLNLGSDKEGSGKKNESLPNELPKKNLNDALERAKNGENNMIPVYFFEVRQGDRNLIYLSNSSIGRIAQRRKWKEIMGAHAPCDTEKLCPACLLFGTTNGRGLKGHIHVTDAEPVDPLKLKWETHTLQILGEPRTTAFEFYLRKPKGVSATYWNFDFYGVNVEDVKGNKHTEYHDLEQAAPRGRKMYWHSPIAQDAEKGKMNSTMEAVQGEQGEQGAFSFKVYFDEITETQLQNLIWVITLGDNRPDSTKQHKLGHAKPLGYGSVKMVVTKKVKREISTNGDSIEIKLDRKPVASTVEPNSDLHADEVKDLLIMCDTSSLPQGIPVMYPKELSEKGEFVYQWFSNNRKNEHLQTLPEPADKKKTLMGSWRVDNGDAVEIEKPRKERSEGKGTPHREGCERRNPSHIMGRVKFYKADQNFGYIEGEDGKDYKIVIDPRFNPGIDPKDLKKGKSVSFLPKNLNGKMVANHCQIQ